MHASKEGSISHRLKPQLTTIRLPAIQMWPRTPSPSPNYQNKEPNATDREGTAPGFDHLGTLQVSWVGKRRSINVLMDRWTHVS